MLSEKLRKRNAASGNGKKSAAPLFKRKPKPSVGRRTRDTNSRSVFASIAARNFGLTGTNNAFARRSVLRRINRRKSKENAMPKKAITPSAKRTAYSAASRFGLSMGKRCYAPRNVKWNTAGAGSLNTTTVKNPSVKSEF